MLVLIHGVGASCAARGVAHKNGIKAASSVVGGASGKHDGNSD